MVWTRCGACALAPVVVVLTVLASACPSEPAARDAAATDAHAAIDARPDAPTYEISIEPPSAEFGDVCVGVDAEASFVLRNTGTAPAGPFEVTLTGPGREDFELVANDCPAILGVGGSCMLSVRFAPRSVGGASARMEVRAPTGSAITTLEGTGATDCGAFLSIVPNPEYFGELLVGSTSPRRTLRVVNAGSEASGVLRMEMGGLHGADFTLVPDGDRCTGRTLMPGSDCSFEATFSPSAEGERVGAAMAVAGAATTTAALRGTGVAGVADVVISPDTTDFGTGGIGCTGAPQVFTVTSSGTIPTGPLAVMLGGPDAASFVVVRNGCATGLPVGESCAVEVGFAPRDNGTLVASLDVTVDGRTRSAEFTGTSAADFCGIPPVIEPSIDDFGPVALGTRSPMHRFIVRQSGVGTTGPLAVAIRGSNPDDFVIDPATSTCEGTRLGPFEICVVDVAFSPTAGGSRSAALRVLATPWGASIAALIGTSVAP
jgi:hypothetical protein